MDRSSPRYRIGYATSGFGCHRLADALEILAELGYRGVFLTLDALHLDPFRPGFQREVAITAALLGRLQLEPVVECGGRFVLDPRSKHQPTLLSRDGAELREAFLRRALEAALDLGAGGISMWSGANVNGLEEQPAWKRLTASVGRLLDEADRLGLWIAFEPEPGMFVETVEGFHRLNEALGDPQHFGLSLDLGHLLVTGEGEPADVLLREREYLLAVAIEDMRRGVHEHLPFGEGDLDLGRTLEALGSSGFQGIVAVELPRHAHDAVEQARQAAGILRAHGVPFRSRAPTGQDGPAPASQ